MIAANAALTSACIKLIHLNICLHEIIFPVFFWHNKFASFTPSLLLSKIKMKLLASYHCNSLTCIIRFVANAYIF